MPVFWSIMLFNVLKIQVGVTEVILAVNYQPQVMLAALESMEKKVWSS